MLALWVLAICVPPATDSFARAIHPWRLTGPVKEVFVGVDKRVIYASAMLGYGVRGFCMTTRPVTTGYIPPQSMYTTEHKLVNCYPA